MRWMLVFLILVITIGCASDDVVVDKGISVVRVEEDVGDENAVEEVIDMKLTSPDFSDNGAIPSKFTCDGDDVSPTLEVFDVPPSAKSLALISDDPDAPAGTWVHWVVWNIPVDTVKMGSGGKVGVEGVTSFGRNGYGGPCPPSGTHRYFFKLYALDTSLDLPTSSKKADLEKAMEGHIVASAQLMGTYSRS